MTNVSINIKSKRVGNYLLKDAHNGGSPMLVVSHRQKYRTFGGDGGGGFIAGQIPGTVTVEGIPAEREIECRIRGHNRKLVDRTWSSAIDGTYRFDDLDPEEEYDLIARDHNRVYRDVIVPAVCPWPYIPSIDGHIPPFFLDEINEDFKIYGGNPPYTVEWDNPTFDLQINDRTLTITGQSPEDQRELLYFSVIDSENVRSKTFHLSVASSSLRAFWRLKFNDTNGGGWYTHTELEFAEYSGGPSVAVGGTAFASSQNIDPIHQADKSFNGIRDNSGWSTDVTWPIGDVWLAYRFPSGFDINVVRMVARDHGTWINQTPFSWTVQSSLDGIEWKDEWTVKNQSGWSRLEEREFRRIDYTPITPVSVSQSSTYPGVMSASPENMMSEDRDTGTGTNNVDLEWILLDLGEPKLVEAITVAGGNLSGWGAVHSYLNGASVEYSDDGTDWTLLDYAWGVSSDMGQFSERTVYTGGIAARYWRLSREGFLSTTRFLLEA